MRPRKTPNGWQRTANIVLGGAVLFVVAWMTYEGMEAPPRKKDVAPPASSSAEVGTVEAVEAVEPTDAGVEVEVVVGDLDAGLFLPSLSLADAGVMPAGAPRNVRIGIVLVTFAGAEGAPPTARSKTEAKAIAERLLDDARTDFHRAVTGGDSGSADDIGRIPRGVLDPQTEISVFGLAKGDVSEVLDTPRGYWIVKRLD